ncbi:MAG: helix-turn-helix domain-containing protein [Cyanobacteriota bacterium]|jgi:AraC family ethanolamine operon transcriptional activator
MQMVFQAIGLEALLLQLEGGGPSTGRLHVLEVPPLQLMRFQLDKSLHTIGSKPKGMFSVTVDLDPRPFEMPWRSHGQAVPVNSLFGLKVNSDIHFTVPSNVDFAIVFIPIDALNRWVMQVGWPGFDGELLPHRNLVLTNPNSTDGLRGYLRQLFALAEQAPDRLRLPANQRLVREDLIPLLLEALVSGPSPTQRVSRPPARIDIVKDLQRWLHDHPTTPVTLADLCREAHASRRTLIQGFQDHLGMGPMAYVKLLRLHGLRRRFVAAGPNEIQIGAMAEAWGFHNAGHFAADYRRLFGESPRETLHRRRPSLG